MIYTIFLLGILLIIAAFVIATLIDIRAMNRKERKRDWPGAGYDNDNWGG